MKSFYNALQWRFDFARLLTPHVSSAGIIVLRLAEDWNRLARHINPRWQVREVRVRPKGYDALVTIRLDASDLMVFQQVFVLQQYKAAARIKDPAVIVDCGANVGYTAIFFLNQFPRARLIVVEPDPDNARLCRRNLRGYGDRAVVLEKALWGSVAKLSFVEESRKPGEEWGIEVREASLDSPVRTVEAIDIPTLMATAGVQSIDLLKIDIEKSEIDVFQGNHAGWLPMIRNIAIELHGTVCTDVFRAALKGYSFVEEQCDEVTFCFDIGPKCDS